MAAVSDPFSASKRSKKSATVLIEDDEAACEIIEVIKEKELQQENEAPVKKQMKLTYPTPTETKLKYNKEDFACDRTDWNLKLVSWNINGIRAWIEVFLIIHI